MCVDQSGQERSLAKIDDFTAVARFDFIKFSDVDNFISGKGDRAIVNGRSIHRNDDSRTKNHSPFTTFRHSATSRLHASWQSSGTVAGIVDPGRPGMPA